MIWLDIQLRDRRPYRTDLCYRFDDALLLSACSKPAELHKTRKNWVMARDLVFAMAEEVREAQHFDKIVLL